MYEVFPGAGVDDRGHVHFAGWDVTDLARRYGTPLYVYDEQGIRRRARRFRDALAAVSPEGHVAYASKAFLSVGIARLFDQEGLWLDVVSGGELFTALRAGFDPGRILFHGNNKTVAEVQMAVEEGVGRIVVDNFPELERLRRVARTTGGSEPVRVLLRVTPGIEAHTHEYIQTGQQDSKFGFDLETGQAIEAARQVIADDRLRLEGFHCHIGSQIFETEPYTLALSVLLQLAERVKSVAGVEIRELNLGGGFGVRYLPGDEPPAIEAICGALGSTLAAWQARTGRKAPALCLEPGRALIAESGLALYTVGGIKRVEGLTPYVAVDGGMADNPRPALYQSRYFAVVANRAASEATEEVSLVGRYCESGDVLIPHIRLAPVEEGDLIAVFTSGAYQLSMASNYNRVPRPAAVLAAPGRAALLIERESYEDLVRHDRLPAWLAGESHPGRRAEGQAD